MTNISSVARPLVPPTPKFCTIDAWTSLTGISRRTTYELLGAGHLEARKINARTLINVEAGLRWIESQPLAKIMPPKSSGASPDSALGVRQRIRITEP